MINSKFDEPHGIPYLIKCRFDELLLMLNSGATNSRRTFQIIKFANKPQVLFWIYRVNYLNI